MPTTDIWPHNFVEMDMKDGKTRYKFAPEKLTIKRVFLPKNDGSKMQYGTGWSFEEDPTPNGQYTGVIWGHPGQWDQESKSFTGPATFPTGQAGDQVVASLTAVVPEDPNQKTFYNVRELTLLNGASAPAAPVAGSAPLPPAPAPGAREEAIFKQVAFKAAVELLSAHMQAGKTGYDPFPASSWEKLAEDVWLSYGLLMSGQAPKMMELPAESDEQGAPADTDEPQETPEDSTDDPEEMPW